MYANVLIGHDEGIITVDINGTGCNAATEDGNKAFTAS